MTFVVKDGLGDLQRRLKLGRQLRRRFAALYQQAEIPMLEVTTLDRGPKDYVARRIAEGHSKLDAIRPLKRYLANAVFTLIMQRQKEINATRIRCRCVLSK